MFLYHPHVLLDLARHGVMPRPHTRPELVREYVRELYKYEIKRLRARLLRGEFPKVEYAGRVDALRRQYPELALQPWQFVEGGVRPEE
jgi:hypothetical protein